MMDLADEGFDFIDHKRNDVSNEMNNELNDDFEKDPTDNNYSGFPHFNIVEQALRDSAPSGYPHHFHPPPIFSNLRDDMNKLRPENGYENGLTQTMGHIY